MTPMTPMTLRARSPYAALRARAHVRWLGLLALTLPVEAFALEPFTNESASLNHPSVHSGVVMGTWDMNEDGLDDIVRLDETQSLEIEYQQPDGTFTLLDYGSIQGDSWGMAIADVDRNGYADIFTGGFYDGLKLLLADDDGADFQLGLLDGPDIFVQCTNFADIDNDGELDLLACHDDGIASRYRGDGTGAMDYDPTIIVPASTVPSDNSGNYGTTWTDYDNDGDLDLYIAKCRLGVNNPNDGRRLNLLFQNDGSGNYTDVAEAAGVRPYAQSWSADFADIDNDGDLDMFLVTHDATSNLYENLGPDQIGIFSEITTTSGMITDLDAIDLGIQTHFEDFDNDGFIDLLVTGRAGQHRLFLNNGGDLTFTAMDNPFPTDNHGIQSAVIGDFNDDGAPDVLAGFATGYNQPSNVADRMFFNAGTDNHYVNVWLTGVASNRSAVGARVEVTSGFGTQIREVRAGEAYGIVNSGTRHFGLGSETTADSIVVRWPSGQVDTVLDPPIDRTIHLTEGCPVLWYRDADNDGFGDPASEPVGGCIPPEGYVEDTTDCDDVDGNNFPGNAEVCDDADNDCNGMIDELPECTGPAGSSSGGGESSSGGGETTGGGVDSSGGATLTGGGESTTLIDATGTDDFSDSSGTGDVGQDETAGGCSCDVSQPSRGWPWLLVAFGVGVRRRRGGAAK